MWRLFLVCMLLFPAGAGADELNYNLVQLEVVERKRVENDLMIVTLQAMSQGNNAKEVAQQVNDDMSWALEKVRTEQAIQSRTLGYQTYPKYSDNLITGWSASQQLELQSDQTDVLSALTGLLQERLKVQNMRFQVRSETREMVQEELIAEALISFKERAELIVTTVGAKNYKLVNISIDGVRSPFAAKNFRAGVAMAAEIAQPQVESGESTVEMSVSGTIQLMF